eukprot:6665552-Pyramimonas_sp.AAC.1
MSSFRPVIPTFGNYLFDLVYSYNQYCDKGDVRTVFANNAVANTFVLGGVSSFGREDHCEDDSSVDPRP